MTRITLREYGTPAREPLSRRDYSALAATNVTWQKALGLPAPPLTIEYDGEHAAISAKGVAGTIKVGALNIEIAPKFLDLSAPGAESWREAFWRILAIAQDGKAVLGRAAGADTDAMSIADLLAEIFLRAYTKGTTRGLPLEYIENVDTSSSVRGSFDSERFAEWMATPWIIPIRESTLSPDTALAHLLGWAAGQLRTLVTSAGKARELDTVRHALGRPGRPAPRLDVAERIQLGVQHEALRSALEVALMFLRGHGVRHGEGNRDVIGFLWRSEDVYERFLFRLCQEAGHRRGLQVRKAAARFALSSTAPPLTTTPDVTFATSEGTVIAVLDAKYKNLNSTPQASDSYQIFTSASHFGCGEVGLVYPSGIERAAGRWIVSSGFGGPEVTIAALSLNLLHAGSASGSRVLVDLVGGWLDGLSLDAGYVQGVKATAAAPAQIPTDSSGLASNDSV